MRYQSTSQGANIPADPAARAEASNEQAQGFGSDALDRIDEFLAPIGLQMREKPMIGLAMVGGVAFAIGALWMLRNSQHQESRFEHLTQSLADYARRWR